MLPMQGIFHGLKHFVLIALILRAMVPAGWMPSTTGEAAFTICSVSAQPGQHGKKAPEKPSHEKPCAFSGIPQLAGAPDVPALVLPTVHAFAAATDRAYSVTIAAHHQPQSPRAPPLNA